MQILVRFSFVELCCNMDSRVSNVIYMTRLPDRLPSTVEVLEHEFVIYSTRWLIMVRICFVEADEYAHTGCYNIECPGFVQVNPKMLLGGPILPVSVHAGPQFEVEITIAKVVN